MIPAPLKKEPDDFDSKVRIPGNDFLDNFDGTPKTNQWKPFWREAINDLYELYNGICAYSGFRICRTTTSPTVEHYKPKSKFPRLAYEWSNLRLLSPRLNGIKSTRTDILDPQNLKDGEVIIEIPTMKLIANPEACDKTRQKYVNSSIKSLKLNEDFLL